MATTLFVVIRRGFLSVTGIYLCTRLFPIGSYALLWKGIPRKRGIVLQGFCARGLSCKSQTFQQLFRCVWPGVVASTLGLGSQGSWLIGTWLWPLGCLGFMVLLAMYERYIARGCKIDKIMLKFAVFFFSSPESWRLAWCCLGWFLPSSSKSCLTNRSLDHIAWKCGYVWVDLPRRDAP
jgi:hypothetical protein